MSLCQIPLEASKHILSREGFRDLIVSWCIFSYNRGALKKNDRFFHLSQPVVSDRRLFHAFWGHVCAKSTIA